jgi:hypothetical protein
LAATSPRSPVYLWPFTVAAPEEALLGTSVDEQPLTVASRSSKERKAGAPTRWHSLAPVATSWQDTTAAAADAFNTLLVSSHTASASRATAVWPVRVCSVTLVTANDSQCAPAKLDNCNLRRADVICCSGSAKVSATMVKLRLRNDHTGRKDGNGNRIAFDLHSCRVHLNSGSDERYSRSARAE